jgi:hypothetical protein
MQTHRSGLTTRLGLFVAVLSISATAGCTTAPGFVTRMPGVGDLDTRPGLADVRVLGPKGRKCYDYCSTTEASCKHMCPNSEGGCQEDCVTDTKNCLEDCPELQRFTPVKN